MVLFRITENEPSKMHNVRPYVYSRPWLDMSYKMYVKPHLEYGNIIFYNQRMDLMDLIERVQDKEALIVSGC